MSNNAHWNIDNSINQINRVIEHLEDLGHRNNVSILKDAIFELEHAKENLKNG